MISRNVHNLFICLGMPTLFRKITVKTKILNSLLKAVAYFVMVLKASN